MGPVPDGGGAMTRAALGRIPTAPRTVAGAAVGAMVVATLAIRMASPARADTVIHLAPARAETATIDYVVSSSNSNKIGSNVKIDMPTGVQVGDLLVAAIYTRGKPTVTSPAGWTFIRHNGKGRLYYRLADGTEPGTYTWTLSKEENGAGSIVVYRGVDPTSPINADSGKKKKDSDRITAPSVSTTVDGAQLVGFYAVLKNSYIKPPSEFTERVDKRSEGSEDRINWEVCDKHQNGSSRTGDKKATATKSGRNVGMMLALAPMSSGGG